MSSAEPVTRAALRRVYPIVAPRRLPAVPERVWSDAEWARIRLGYRARDMDEKWNMFAEGDTLYIHRSWTGHGIYEVSFTRGEGGVRIAEVVVESDRNRHRSRSDEFDGMLVELLICSGLLGEEATELRQRLWG